MFGTTTEKKVAREADRIVSLKEDVDALSWNRVLEIGKQLREQAADDAQIEYARELVAIAQSNISLANRLGIDPAPSSNRIMPSGMEVVEGGFAEAALDKAPQEDAPPAEVATETLKVEFVFDSEPTPEAQSDIVIPIDDEAFARAVASLSDESVPTFEPEEPPVCELVEELHTDAAVPTEKPVEPLGDSINVAEEPTESVEVPVQKPAEEPAKEPAEKSTEESAKEPDEEPVRADDPIETSEEPVKESVQECAEPIKEPEPIQEEEVPQPQSQSQKQKHKFARFRSVYESRDGNLCVYEDDQGHLVAVDASKLA